MLRQCVTCGKQFEWQPQPCRPPMTCSTQCHNKRRAEQNERSRQRASARGCPDHMHGTSTGYSYYRCGCPRCTQWSRLYKQEQRKKAKQG